MSRYFRILSLDGGGIRGIIPAQVLVTLEKKLQQASGKPGLRVADCFDLVAGTSTGGILACLHLCPQANSPARPRYSAEEALNFYFERGPTIFERSIWESIKTAGGVADEKYPAVGLETALHDYFQDTLLSQLVKPCLIPAYHITQRAEFFFTQHDAVGRHEWDFFVRDVGRATSAAPTFFECARAVSRTGIAHPLIDGGLFANNPALCAFAEARTQMPGRPQASQMAILSLGTGSIDTPYYYDDVKHWGMVEWMRPALDMMLSSVTETVDYQMRQLYTGEGMEQQYLRIQPEIPPSLADIDNTTPNNLNTLQTVGQNVAEQYDRQLDEMVTLLLA